jgi:hypothetical protein
MQTDRPEVGQLTPSIADVLAAFRRSVPRQDQLAGIRVAGPPPGLVPIRLVPVEVFGGDCDCHEDTELAAGEESPCDGFSYGLADAVSSYSDCNRAEGRIFRRDEDESPRADGDTITVWVAPDELVKFEKRFGDKFTQE